MFTSKLFFSLKFSCLSFGAMISVIKNKLKPVKIRFCFSNKIKITSDLFKFNSINCADKYTYKLLMY